MADQGASYAEQILEAARRNNTELFQEILKEIGPEEAEKIASVINNSKDLFGNTSLHLAAQYGNYEVLDEILDQDLVEVDPKNTIDEDTPLHVAVNYSLNNDFEKGYVILETLIEAGSDARVRNKRGLKPVDLSGGNEQIRELLQSAELAHQLEEDEAKRNDDEGSASESDDE